MKREFLDLSTSMAFNTNAMHEPIAYNVLPNGMADDFSYIQ